jgi:hypothetical protein
MDHAGERSGFSCQNRSMCVVSDCRCRKHIQYTGVLDDAASTSSPAPDQCTAHGCSGGAGFTCSVH